MDQIRIKALEGETLSEETKWSILQAGYLRRLREMDDTHGDLLLPAAKAALDEQTERADHLDEKASRAFTAAVAAVGAFSALSRQVVGSGEQAASLWLLAGVGVLLVAAVVAAVAAHVTPSWQGSDPNQFLADGVVQKGHTTDLRKHLLLHYLDCFERNVAVANWKGTLVQVAQLALIVGIGLVAVAATTPKAKTTASSVGTAQTLAPAR